MSTLFKKLKKVNLAKRLFYYLTTLLYLGSLIYFIYGITHLSNIETFLRVIAIVLFTCWFLFYLLSGLITIIGKKTIKFIIITIITFIFIPIQLGSSYIINYFYGSLKSMNKEVLTYRTNLITLKDYEFSSDSIIGMVESEDDIEGVILAQELLEEKNYDNRIEKYTGYEEMIRALYAKEIDAALVSGNYTVFIIENEDGTQLNVGEDTKIIDYIEKDMVNQDNQTLSNSKEKKLTEPFTALIMGVDSEYDGLKPNQAFNGDTLILVTFNPKTLTATMFSIPRDTYVPIACNNNRYAKINSSAAYGSTCVINTIQKLTGIDIDYYVKMNFTGVVDLVNVLGGVEVDVDKPDFTFNMNVDCHGGICEQNSKRAWGSQTVYIKPGKQTLNGEEALAYARNRHQWRIGDLARNLHQQQVIEAIALKMKGINRVSEFKKILDTISRNLETNVTPEQIMSFYDVGKDILLNVNSNALSIKKTFLNCYNLPVWRGYSTTSALGYQPASLQAIVNLMKENLGLKEKTPIKTFEFSINDDYSTPMVGQYEYGGEILRTMPNYRGYGFAEAQSWCNANGFTCTAEYVDDTNPYGIIVDQSLHANTLLKEVWNKNVTFYLSNGKGGSTTPSTETDDDDDNKENNDNNGNNENNDNNENNNSGNENNNNNNDNNDNNENGNNNNNENTGGNEEPSNGE